MEKVYFRCDGGDTIGLGHFIRGYSLALELIDRGVEVTFYVCSRHDVMDILLQQSNITCVERSLEPGSDKDRNWFMEEISKETPDWIILDGYHFDPRYQESIHALAGTMVVDDHAPHDQYFADVILNQNLHARREMYTAGTSEEPEWLLGPDYVMLRPEFLDRQSDRDILRVDPEVNLILVSPGGGASSDVVRTMIEGLRIFKKAELSVEFLIVLGDQLQFEPRFKNMLDGLDYTLEYSTDNMMEYMTSSDIALVSAGSTVWELAFLGIPTLVIAYTDNQVPIARSTDTEDLTIDLGNFEDITPTKIADRLIQLCNNYGKRKQMSERGRELIDGRGAKRVASTLEKKVCDS